MRIYWKDKERTFKEEYAKEYEKKYAKKIKKEYEKEYATKLKNEVTKEVTKEAAEETAKRMIQKGKLSLEDISEYVPSLTMEELKRLEAEVLQPV
jgi:3-oxoacyl-[acyl-carrier-protein] synthase III